ncbi:MAG: hypothetical protein KAI39_08240, partial [Desulfobulbaceae bacterium]|nr:hypothetical protein [Desulfobulbaceae bacterium]
LNPTLDETVTLRMGAFWANFDATVKAYGQDFNQDESIDAGDVDFSISGLWRITPRLRLEAGYTGISKESTESLDAATNVGSLTIPAGLSLNSKFETEVLRLSLGYAFMRSDSSEFGVDLGVNVTSIKESFRANIPGHSGINITTFDVSEPLPTIGLFFNYAFSSEWYFTSRFGAFAFDIGDIDGTIFDAFGGVEYRPWQNVGFGLAYMYNSADLTITDGGIKTDIEYDYNGPLLYLTVGF